MFKFIQTPLAPNFSTESSIVSIGSSPSLCDLSIPCSQQVTLLTQPQANEGGSADSTEGTNHVMSANNTPVLSLSQDLYGRSDNSIQRHILERIASAEERLVAIQGMVASTIACKEMKLHVTAMLREQLELFKQASQASQSQLPESIGVNGSDPEHNEPVDAGPSSPFNAQVRGIQTEVLPQAVATALASADVLNVNIIARYHALQSQQKPEDLYDDEALKSRYGDPVILRGEPYYKIPINLLGEENKLRKTYFASKSGKFASYITENRHRRNQTERDFQFLDGFWSGSYMRIKLMSDAPDGYTTKGIHSVIGLMFLVKPVSLVPLYIHHMDHNTRNNVVSNFQWLDTKENAVYGSGKPVEARNVATGGLLFFKSKKLCYESVEFKMDKRKLNDLINRGEEFKGHIFRQLPDRTT